MLPGDITAHDGIHQGVGGDIHRVGFELVVFGFNLVSSYFQAAAVRSLWFLPGCPHVPRDWGCDAPQQQDGQAGGHPGAQGAAAGGGLRMAVGWGY